MQKVSLLAVAARYLQHRAEQQATGAAPAAYQLLYDFWAGRSDWQQAAGAQLALARRLAAEAPPDEDTLGRIAVALGAPHFLDHSLLDIRLSFAVCKWA